MRTKAARCGACLALLCAPAAAQVPEVVISEINFTPQFSGDDQWIELFNRSGNAVDLSNWSLYQATATPLRANNYWFGFPPNTSVPAGSFVRVHWLAPIPSTAPPATDIYTGDTVFHFLFGYGAEILNPDSGALALLRSQDNNLMNDPNIFVDWVSWGSTGFPRESLAIQAGLWTAGAFVPGAVQNDSIARSIASIGTLSSPHLEFFRDASPTPLAANAVNANVSATGQGCAITGRLPSPPVLSARSFPAPGNRDFVMQVSNTTGIPNEVAAVVLTNTMLPSPAGFFGCPVYVDYTNQIGFLIQSTQAARTDVTALDFSAVSPSLGGVLFHAQAVVLDMSGPVPVGGPHAFSNALSITIGQ